MSRAATSPAEFSDSPLSRVLRQPLILGLFLPVQSGGWSASLLPRTTDWTFDYNAALTKRAEQLGFDLVFGLAQWTSKGGYGGISILAEPCRHDLHAGTQGSIACRPAPPARPGPAPGRPAPPGSHRLADAL
jgi:hypothetical protein